MGEVNWQVLVLKNAALNKLEQVIDHDAFAITRSQHLQARTGFTVGGHVEGDRIIADVTQAIACLERTRIATERAISEARQIGTTTDEPEE